jgi:hypothetical protein
MVMESPIMGFLSWIGKCRRPIGWTAFALVFAESTVTTQHLADGIAGDYDGTGRLVGLEILDVRNRLGSADAFRRIILEGVGGLMPSHIVPHP